jgi:hypothetical protein
VTALRPINVLEMLEKVFSPQIGIFEIVVEYQDAVCQKTFCQLLRFDLLLANEIATSDLKLGLYKIIEQFLQASLALPDRLFLIMVPSTLRLAEFRTTQSMGVTFT